MSSNFNAYSRDELDRQPFLGTSIDCPRCGDPHPIWRSSDACGNPVGPLSFYSCPQTGHTYLAGIHGRRVPPPPST